MKTILILLFGSSLYLFVNSIFLMVSDVLIGQIITGSVTLLVGYMTYRTSQKVNKVASSVDGMKSELVKSTKDLGEKVGAEAGRQQKIAEDETARLQKRSEDREDKIDKLSLPDEQDKDTVTKPPQ